MAALRAVPTFLRSHLESVNQLNSYFTPDTASVAETVCLFERSSPGNEGSHSCVFLPQGEGRTGEARTYPLSQVRVIHSSFLSLHW